MSADFIAISIALVFALVCDGIVFVRVKSEENDVSDTISIRTVDYCLYHENDSSEQLLQEV